jgi:hypothetical protein
MTGPEPAWPADCWQWSMQFSIGGSMTTVREMIQQLLEFNLDMEVEYEDVECGGSLTIDEIRTGISCGKKVVVIG